MKKVICLIMTVLIGLTIIGCGSSRDEQEITKESTDVVSKDENADEKKEEVDLLNPFDLKVEKLSEHNVLLDGYNCKVQFHSLETCRLMLSSNHNKSEESFSFIGYVYEEDNNIPDAVFIDNTVEVTNASIYVVGLVGGKEEEEQSVANPAIAKYKYSKTSDTTAVITTLENKAVGSVQTKYATEVNERIKRFKEIIANR